MTTWTGYYFRVNGVTDLATEDNNTLSSIDLVGPYVGDDVDGDLRANEGDTINGSEVVDIYASATSGVTIRIGGVDYAPDAFFVYGMKLANGETIVSPNFSGTENQAIIDALNLSGGVIDSISFGSINSASILSRSEDFSLLTARYGGPVCFACGTFIATPSGNTRVEDLSVGDTVCTLDKGAMRVRWIIRTRFSFCGDDHRHKPILIQANSFGPGFPAQDLVVSPQHRILLVQPAQERNGQNVELLIQAKALVGLPGIRQKRGTRDVTYHSLLLDSHQILTSNNLPTESFFPGPMALRMLGSDERDSFCAKFPDLLRDGYGRPARKTLSMPLAQGFVKRLQQQGGLENMQYQAGDQDRLSA